jgi:hypothetical protein
MAQDPYAAFAAPVQAQQQPVASYDAFSAPVQQPAPRRAPPARRPAPAGQTMAAPAQAPVLNELGITDQEEREALLAQGYSPEEVTAFMANPDATAVSDQSAAAVLARYKAAYPDDTAEIGVVQQGDPNYPGSDAKWDEAAGVWVALSPQEQAAKREAERRIGSDPGIADRVRALTSGMSFGLSDELERALVEAQGRGENFNRRILGEEMPYTSQQLGEAYERAAAERSALYAKANPVESFGLQLAGGVFAPGMSQAGSFINQGVTGAARTARATGVGAGMGFATGVGNAEGDFVDRLDEGALGAAIGAGTGNLAQRIGNRTATSRPEASQTPARQLSREGTELTLGQMLQSTPGVGGAIKATEDRIAGLPFVGDMVKNAQNRTLESANRTGMARALRAIGEEVPPGTPAGYDGIDFIQNRMGAAYDDVASRSSLTFDQPLYDDLTAILADAPSDMGDARARQLAQILDSRVYRNFGGDDGMSVPGDEFKRIESVLGQQRRELVRSPDSDQQALGRALGDVQTSFRDALGRQNPAEAERLQAINTGYANLVRLEDAAGAVGNAARGGVFTPSQLAQSVRRNTGTLASWAIWHKTCRRFSPRPSGTAAPQATAF